MSHIVKSYEGELEQLAGMVSRMGGLAEAQLKNAIEAIYRRDSDLARAVIESDQKVDELELEIEDAAIRLLALRQPVANDLRAVVSGLKIASDLERIGDFAKNLGKRALVLNEADPVTITNSIAELGRLALEQISSVLDSFSSLDASKALYVWRNDERLDDMYNSIFRELLTYMMEDPRHIGLCTHLMFIAKNIERVGDHVTNIAELIHYLVTGERLSDDRPKADVTSSADV